MELIIKKAVAEELGLDFFERWGAEEDAWASWRTQYAIDLAALDPKQLNEFKTALEPHRKIRGVSTLLWDLENWLNIVTNGVGKRHCRTVRQYEVLLKRYLLKVPGHRLYKRHEEGAWLCFFVSKIDYNPPQSATSNSRAVPASVDMDLTYEAVGGIQDARVSFYATDCIEIPIEKTLALKGYLIETDELRADYLKTRERFREIAPQVGRQFWASGKGSMIRERHSYSRVTDTIQLEDMDGERSRVVIDVFHEEGEEQRDKSRQISDYFWPNVDRQLGYDEETDTVKTSKKKVDASDNEDEDIDDEGFVLSEDTTLERPKNEIPIHPWLIVYHLTKHQRVQAHVNQLDEYVYDTNIAEKLILPADQKELVQLLIDTGGGVFKDIVRGKGGGAVVLLVGPPGTGKTLTAEVYAESEQRALYSVQCSQLGVKPEDLEEELLKIFDRAKRWGAVILLDEADVYIHARGSNLHQNAIVGVFLRVLEYQGATMFLCSNRPKSIDDAIASRCIARLEYKVPNAADATAIWGVLTSNSGIKMPAAEIAKVVKEHPDMTGRDIKNIIKLAALMPASKNGITAKMATYVHQFKPTGV